MPRSHKPRKRYIAKHVRVDAHLVAVDRPALVGHRAPRAAVDLRDAPQLVRLSLNHWAWITGPESLKLGHRGWRAS